MLRILLAFLFFALSSVSLASKTYYYYSTSNNFCSSVPDTVCTSLNSNGGDIINTYAGQYQDRGDGITCGFNRTLVDYNGPGKSVYQPFSGSFSTAYHGFKTQIVCADDETMELNGCTATCITDPCKPFKDQEATGLVTCGTASCPSPTTFEGNAQIGMGCTGGAKTQIIPNPSASAVINGCAATLKAGQAVPTSAKIKTSAAGSSSTTSYCNATYVYTGTSSQPYDQPTDLASLSFGGVTATTENGQCPSGTVKGQLNSSWVCVAESNKGTNAGCPTGQIKDNQGQCVPFAEAGNGSGSGDGSGGGGVTCTITGQTQVNGYCQCPSGQTVQNNQCTVSDGSGGGGGTCTITGQTQVNGSCQCPTGQTVQNGACSSSGQGSSGSYTGSNKCEQAPACTGDVVLCGLVAEQYKTKCDTLEALSSLPEGLSEKLDKIGTATNDPKIGVAESNANNILNELSQKIGFSNTSCPADMSIHVLAKTIIIPISETCNLLKLIRLLLHLATYFFCLRMLWSTVATV